MFMREYCSYFFCFTVHDVDISTSRIVGPYTELYKIRPTDSSTHQSPMSNGDVDPQCRWTHARHAEK